MSCYIQTNDAGVFGFAAVKTCQIKKVEDINLASLDLEQEVISCNLVKTDQILKSGCLTSPKQKL